MRVLEEEGESPVRVITDLNADTARSITNIMEILEAELIAKHFPARFKVGGEDQVVLIEHFEPLRRGMRGKPSYFHVTFES